MTVTHLLDNLPILLIFIRSNFCVREMLQLRSSSLRCLLFSVSSTFLVLSYHQIHATLAWVRRLHLSFDIPTTS
jgi:hypothetical protein